MFVLGLGDRGAYHMGSKIAKKFNYFFPPFIRKTVYSFREERYKSQTSQVFTGGGGGMGVGGHALLCICLKDQIVSI